MHRRSFLKTSGTAGLITLISPSKNEFLQILPVQSTHGLASSFQSPDILDYPQTFWFWMNGHISKEGITLDLEAMKRAGIGGVFNFDAGISIPKGPVDYLSQEWLELKKHAVNEAKRLGLQFTMHNCPGWSSSGGPWITPEMAMKQITWSEVTIKGGEPINTHLPLPFHQLNYYRDVAVLAYPSLQAEVCLQDYGVNTSNGPVSKQAVTGQEGNGVIVRPTNEQNSAWLQFEFTEPCEVRSITFLVSAVDHVKEQEKNIRYFVALEASDNGVEFKNIANISTGLEAELLAGDKFITYDIAPTKATFFRLRSQKARRYSQVRFSGIERLNAFMEKTGNRFMFSGSETSPIYTTDLQQVKGNSVINSNQIIDVTGHLDKVGSLQWNAPEGYWTILRFGYTASPTINKAAPETGTGLECDKFSKTAIDFHFNNMLHHLMPAFKVMQDEGSLGLEIDSYEAGSQTWTEKFPEEFEKSRGYNIRKFLVALTGRILNSVDHTERFLWDYRRTQADLIAQNYYGRFTALCHQHNITSYIQPYDKGPFEEMQIGARADVNLGEFWYGLHSILQGNRAVQRTSKLAASIMSTNGRKEVGAESFTSEPESSRWQEYPFALKALGDKMFCNGINKMIIHRFVHQPNPFASPGMTMGPWGIYFDRTNTWFDKAKDWLQYTARCQMLLKQGWPVRDLLYFTGEEGNVYTQVERNELHPTPPEGYDYDLINAETLFSRVRIENGFIQLPHGMKYRLLVLQDYKGVTLKLLKKIRSLVSEGMILVGKKPEHSLGLFEYTDDAEFKKTADELWGRVNGKDVTRNNVGKGTVIWGTSLTTILESLGIKPDFHYTSRAGDAPLLFTHRSSDDADIYFVCNQRRTVEEVVCSFRVKNKQPQIWDAATGNICPALFYECNENSVQMPLRLEPYGSFFILFRSPASGRQLLSIKKEDRLLLDTKPFPVHPRKRFPDLKNNFTIALWAKPEMNIMTRTSIHMGNVKHSYTDYYAIYPSPGKTLYGEGHATCGLAIGRNGVAVWENESYPVLVLVGETPIAGWSHIILQYVDGVPSVYVNGEQIASGKQSAAILHPGVGEVYMSESASYYNGDMTNLRLFKEVLHKDQIRKLANEKLPSPLPPPVVETTTQVKKSSLLFWQNGHYTVRDYLRKEKVLTITGIQQPMVLTNDWEVEFPPNLGAPPKMKMPELISLHKVKEGGVKYFSGTANYKKEFTLTDNTFSENRRVYLDLGRVEVIAQVHVNGKDLGILWKPPFRTDITYAVKPGKNLLQICVTNLWPNRLIGDEQEPDPDNFVLAGASGFEHLMGAGFEKLIGSPIQKLPDWYVRGKPKPENGRIAFTTWKHYTKGDPLLESGLLGPVSLRFAVLRTI